MAAILALWFFSSFPDARVFITASIAKQVTEIIWREITRLHALAARRGTPLDGVPAKLAGTGLRASDGRQIVGFANATREDAAGISGANLFYIFDEATGIDDEIIEAAEGNQAGAGGTHRIFMISNPTRCEGEFYRAFNDLKNFYWTRQISSRQSPNIQFPDRPVVPGLAGREWLEDMSKKHGETSPWFLIHVEGKFVEGEEGRILTLHDIASSCARLDSVVAEGHLVVGLDPAGPGVGGDESVFFGRRGLWSDCVGGTEMTAEALFVMFQGLLTKWAPNPRERVTVVIDRDGLIGARVFSLFRAEALKETARFRVVGVRSGDNAVRQPNVYKTVRDELWAGVAAWIKEKGGASPEHQKR